jgi:hypothetical protein
MSLPVPGLIEIKGVVRLSGKYEDQVWFVKGNVSGITFGRHNSLYNREFADHG